MTRIDVRSPKEVRKERLALIKRILEDVKKQLDHPDVQFWDVFRDRAESFYDRNICKTGYGLATTSGHFFWRKREKRLVEIDCNCDGTSPHSSLQVETFDEGVIAPTRSAVQKFAAEINQLFGEIEYTHFGKHITEFEQRVGACRKALGPLTGERK